MSFPFTRSKKQAQKRRTGQRIILDLVSSSESGEETITEPSDYDSDYDSDLDEDMESELIPTLQHTDTRNSSSLSRTRSTTTKNESNVGIHSSIQQPHKEPAISPAQHTSPIQKIVVPSIQLQLDTCSNVALGTPVKKGLTQLPSSASLSSSSSKKFLKQRKDKLSVKEQKSKFLHGCTKTQDLKSIPKTSKITPIRKTEKLSLKSEVATKMSGPTKVEAVKISKMEADSDMTASGSETPNSSDVEDEGSNEVEYTSSMSQKSSASPPPPPPDEIIDISEETSKCKQKRTTQKRTPRKRTQRPARKRKIIDPKKSESDDDILFEVESVIKKRTRRGQVQYKLRWAGYNKEHDSWEPEHNVQKILIEEYEDPKPRRKRTKNATLQPEPQHEHQPEPHSQPKPKTQHQPEPQHEHQPEPHSQPKPKPQHQPEPPTAFSESQNTSDCEFAGKMSINEQIQLVQGKWTTDEDEYPSVLVEENIVTFSNESGDKEMCELDLTPPAISMDKWKLNCSSTGQAFRGGTAAKQISWKEPDGDTAIWKKFRTKKPKSQLRTPKRVDKIQKSNSDDDDDWTPNQSAPKRKAKTRRKRKAKTGGQRKPQTKRPRVASNSHISSMFASPPPKVKKHKSGKIRKDVAYQPTNFMSLFK